MKAYTIKELKEAITNCPELTDDSPVYLNVISKCEDGSEEGEMFAMEAFAVTNGGGHVSIVGYTSGLDAEDHEILS